jgi:hypothetical protein
LIKQNPAVSSPHFTSQVSYFSCPKGIFRRRNSSLDIAPISNVAVVVRIIVVKDVPDALQVRFCYFLK